MFCYLYKVYDFLFKYAVVDDKMFLENSIVEK